MKNIFFVWVIFVGFTGGLFSQEVVDSNFVIGEEDVLSIDVWKESDLSVKERSVRSDGMITLPLLGEIQASGKTVKQLQDEIAEKLKDLIVNPNVTVEVVRIFSQKVSVNGQVSRPGQYALGAPVTVLDVLSRAGGPTADAKSTKIKILRMVNGREIYFTFNYKDALKGKNIRQNILLENGDRVLVP